MAVNTQNITSLFGSRLSSAYNSLRGELGVPQTATDTIDKLVDRIQTSPAVEDRRTAVLGLKGLSRDWKEVCQLAYLKSLWIVDQIGRELILPFGHVGSRQSSVAFACSSSAA